MDIEKIEEGSTYKIRQTGGSFTFGTVVEIREDEGARETVVIWESDHPEADGTQHWCRPTQVVMQVADGTYLGDDGKARR